MQNELSITRTPPEPTTFFFPLRTNVKYFDSPGEQLALEERVKQASLLYDTLLFESGLYLTSVWNPEQGNPSVDMVIPPHQLDVDALEEEDRRFQPTGGQAHVLIDGHVFAAGPAERQFRAQFHTLLKKLQADSLPWIRTESFELTSEGKESARRLGQGDERLLTELMPTASPSLRSKIAQNLNRDVVLASGLGAVASPDPLFAPLAHAKAAHGRGVNPALGLTALQVALPDWSDLPWERIVDLRDHPSLVEFRQKMVAVERVAREAVAQNETLDLNFKVAQIFNQEYLDELFKVRATYGDVARDMAIDLVTGAIPIPGFSALVSGARAEEKVRAQNSSWLTAFFKLQGRA
jgi:hypothetical protein